MWLIKAAIATARSTQGRIPFGEKKKRKGSLPGTY